MINIIKRGSSKEEVIAKMNLLNKTRKKLCIDLKKYCGSIQLKKDPLLLQKSWRNEWE